MQAWELGKHGSKLNVRICVCRWAESELLDTLMRLEIGLAGRVEAWKATRWATKLEQLKSKSDSLVSPTLCGGLLQLQQWCRCIAGTRTTTRHTIQWCAAHVARTHKHTLACCNSSVLHCCCPAGPGS
jgi:hypothetical protein